MSPEIQAKYMVISKHLKSCKLEQNNITNYYIDILGSRNTKNIVKKEVIQANKTAKAAVFMEQHGKTNTIVTYSNLTDRNNCNEKNKPHSKGLPGRTNKGRRDLTNNGERGIKITEASVITDRA